MSDDWVSTRGECSIINMWLRLKSGAQRDVDAANEFYKRKDGRKFGIVPDVTSFTVYKDITVPVRLPAAAMRSISFSLDQNDTLISVSDERGISIFGATVTLNKNRQCMLVVDGEELEEWEFRKKALEGLFF